MVTRRGILACLLWTPWALAAKLDVLLVGDSHAYMLEPRLRRAARARGRSILGRAKGGTSARQWREKRWFRDELVRHPTDVVLISLGTNATSTDRRRLLEDVSALTLEAIERKVRPVWLASPTRSFDVSYLDDALEAAGVEVIQCGELQLEHDKIHATDRALRVWSETIARELWS